MLRDAKPEIIQMLELSDKDFKTAILSILHVGRLDPLEMVGKIKVFSREIQSIKKD